MLTLKDGGLNHFGAAVVAAKEINGDRDFISHTWFTLVHQGLEITFWDLTNYWRKMSSRIFMSDILNHFLAHGCLGFNHWLLASKVMKRNNFVIFSFGFWQNSKIAKLPHHFSTSQFSCRQRAWNV